MEKKQKESIIYQREDGVLKNAMFFSQMNYCPILK